MSDTTFEEVFGNKPAEPAATPAPAPSVPVVPLTENKPEPPAPAAAPAPPPAPEPDKPKVDPEQFKGYLDEREKRQKYERELEDLRRENQHLKQQAAPKEPPPNIYDNPEGYQAHLQAQYEQRLTQMKLEQSEFLATRDYGAETINEVKAWASRLPGVQAEALLSKASPFHAAVEAYRQEKAASVLAPHGYDLEKLKAEWAKEYEAKRSGAAPAVPQAPAPSVPQNLPPKIAGAGGLVAQTPVQSEADFFASVFQPTKRK